jgi:glycine/D-amino acid oxidase-like deaminating enzyme
MALWKGFGAEAGEGLGIRTEGGLMLAEDSAGLDWLRRKSAMERRWGIESHVLGANELHALAPALSERMVGADFVPAEGYGDPLRGTLAVLKLAQRAGWSCCAARIQATRARRPGVCRPRRGRSSQAAW